MKSTTNHNKNCIDIINIISNILIATIAIFSLFFSITQYISISEKERLSNRPIITELYGTMSWDSTPTLRFVPILRIRNVGIRPATEVEFKSTIIETGLDKKIYLFSDSISEKYKNPLPNGVDIDFGVGTIIPKPKHIFYIKMKFIYKENISKSIYNDSLYFKLEIPTNKLFEYKFKGVNVDEANKIDSILIYY